MGLDDPAIVHAWVCPEDGPAQILDSFTAVRKARADGHLVWVHLNRAQSDSADYLRELLMGKDPLLVGAMLAEDTRPRVEPIDNGAMIMLRGANLNPGAEADDLINLRIWAEPKLVITVRTRKLRLVKEVQADLEKGVVIRDGAMLLGMLINRLMRNLEPLIHMMDEETDELETEVLDSPDAKMRSRIVAVRTRSIELRRYILPQRETLGRLRLIGEPLIGDDDRFTYQELHDMSLRLVEELDSVRERAAVLQDELTNYLADKLNKRLYLLSVVAAIFLPLGFFTGLLGVNVGGIPMAENPHGFLWFSVIMVVLVIGQVALFRWLKWF